ncbi:Chitin synthase export chaperone [Paramyrothecium foliicola]|nr:Chitin synthase export chaperone [Paramyrothecium foliicola]
MGSTDFGNFEVWESEAMRLNSARLQCTLPSQQWVLTRLGATETNLYLLQLFSPNHDQDGPWQGCQLRGIPLSGNRYLGNLGSILLAFFAIVVSAFLLFRSERKKAAVGRREMQLFLLGYIIISICEIFSVGLIPFSGETGQNIRIAFSAIHIGMIAATTWVLMLNAVVGYQLIDDGTILSLGLMVISGAALLIGTGYIALDTGFQFTNYWDNSYEPPNRHIALYVLYQLVPLIFLVAFYVLETILVLRVLGETRPMIYLTAAAVLFAIGQVFNYAVSRYICDGTDGKIDGALFQTLFTLLSVVTIWIFWSSITEDDWPMPVGTTYP